MKIGVSGITGKMGKAVIQEIINNEFLELSSGLVRANSGLEGKDIGELVSLDRIGIFSTDKINEFVLNCDAIIDFSSPALSLELAECCAAAQKVFVCGTTGLNESEKNQLTKLAQKTVIIWSANMSIGVNLLLNLIEKASSVLHEDYDVEIVEMHHNQKLDSPSGTALLLGSAVASGRNVVLQEVANMSRFGIKAKRKKGEIGFAALRGGDVIGDHSVIFAGNGERIEFSHKSSNRDIFAKGAVRAAIWGSGKKAGFYSIRDVLNANSR